MTKINLVIFATSSFHKSSLRLKKQAELSGWFSRIFLYGEDDVRKKWYNGQNLQEKHAKNEKVSYFSNFWWKPMVVLKALDEVQENDILLYLDAGCAINAKGADKFQGYVNLCERGPGFVGFGASRKNYVSGFPQFPNEKTHTKRDVIKLLDCEHPIILETSQITGGVFFVKKNDFGLSLIQEWDKLASIDFYFNECPGYYENYPEFKGHKHDQSILSLLVKKRWDILDDYLLDSTFVANNKKCDPKLVEPIKATRIRDEHENSPIWNFPDDPTALDAV